MPIYLSKRIWTLVVLRTTNSLANLEILTVLSHQLSQKLENFNTRVNLLSNEGTCLLCIHKHIKIQWIPCWIRQVWWLFFRNVPLEITLVWSYLCECRRSRISQIENQTGFVKGPTHDYRLKGVQTTVKSIIVKTVQFLRNSMALWDNSIIDTKHDDISLSHSSIGSLSGGFSYQAIKCRRERFLIELVFVSYHCPWLVNSTRTCLLGFGCESHWNRPQRLYIC